MAGPTKNSEGGKKMSKNEIPKQDPKQKKGLTNALKYFFGVGDAGFVLMSNIETFYFMTFLTDLAGVAAGVAGVINSVFTIVMPVCPGFTEESSMAQKQSNGGVTVPGRSWFRGWCRFCTHSSSYVSVIMTGSRQW